jgi:hypothetical protein
MAKNPGEQLDIHDPLLEATLRAMQRKNVSPQAEKEFNLVGDIAREDTRSSSARVNRDTGKRVDRNFGGDIAAGATDDLNRRRGLLLREFDENMSTSERNFMEKIKTGGLSAGLGMFDSQFGAITQTNVNRQQQLTQQNAVNQEIDFLSKESELDRILNRENFAGQLRMSENQRRAEEKKKKGGLFGSIFGSILGFAAAPFTGGASLIPAATSLGGGLARQAAGGN